MSEVWFNPGTFGAYYGAIAGSVVGLSGAAIGTFAGILGPRGKGRRWVLGAMVFIVLLGIAQLAFGIAALATGQPYGVWYPPALIGLMSAVIFGSLFPVVRKRYAEAERRRLEAEGLRGS
jgi:hypothetical protein